jgi:mycofactocin system transcriptional regulator
MFAAQGYDAVTIDALADAAGIGRRTFFRYFPTKADTLMADFDRDLARLQAALRNSDPDLTIMDALRRAIVEVSSAPDQDFAGQRVRLELQSANPTLLANSVVHFERWQRVVAEFAADRLGQPADALLPQVIARAAFGALLAGFSSWQDDATGELAPDLDAALAALASGFDNLTPPSPAASETSPRTRSPKDAPECGS